MSLGPRYRRLFTASVVSNLGDGVGFIAYPWLASAVTRNPLLIAIVAVAQRLPWLVFTLPAGVITDRIDRKRAMVAMDTVRAVLTVGVALAVLASEDVLPSPDALDDVTGTQTGLYLAVLVATLLLGMAEVLRDNSAQTFLPAIVASDDLEKANGRMWSAELVANTFAGPALGSLLLTVGFALPFLVDAASFAAAAALVALIPGTFRVDAPASDRQPWRTELADGFRYLWHDDLLRTMAISLGVMNGLGQLANATFVLFAQEVLGVGPLVFALLATGAALGGIVGGLVGSRITTRFGAGPCLVTAVLASALSCSAVGVATRWPVVWVMGFVEFLFGTLWNVITVSFRQTVIPDRLLGRANSVYRFFGWGMMPIGSALGGLLVVVADQFTTREVALRLPWLLAGVCYLALAVVVRARLTTERLETARARARPATA